MIRRGIQAALITAVLGIPTLASAQTALGSIAGTVRDTTGAVLPGVTVEASSPALIEKVRVAATDGEGRYQITELRPGTYAVTFTLEGFTVVKRDGIELNTGFTATINADLRVGSVSETITVSGQTPVVDLQNTKQQVVVTRDVIDNVPTGRSFQNIGVLIPGVVSAGVVGSPVNQDVGGGSGQSFMTLGIHGGRTADQRIDLDGMSTSAWTRPDSSAIVFTDGNIEEYNISVAANSAESETGGVRINLIPREGGNRFTGGFFGNYGSPDLQSSNNDDRLRGLGLRDANRLKTMWSVNPTFGGPIKQDKLWFFATYTYSVTDTLVGDAYLLNDPTAWTFNPDTSKQAVDDQYSKDISTRLTYQASPRNKFAGYLSYNNTCHCHFLIGRANSAFNVNSEASTLLFIPNKVAQVTWTSPVTSKLLFELGYSHIIENQQFNPRPESTAPQITDIGLSVIYRGTISNLTAFTPVYGSRGAVSYVTGSHALKMGFTLTAGRYDNTSRRTGDVSFLAINGTPLQATYTGTPTFSTNRIRPNLGLYAQDQWSIRRLTVNAGLRFDYLRNDYPDQSVPRDAVRPRRPLVPGPGSGELEGRESPAGDVVRRVRHREDGVQGHVEPVRPGRRHQPCQRHQPHHRQQLDDPDVDGRERRPRRPGRPAEPPGQRRAGDGQQPELRQAGHDLPLRSRLGVRLCEAAVQLGVLDRGAARSGPARVGQRILLPAHLRQLHRHGQPGGGTVRLHAVLRHGADGHASVDEWTADLRAVRSQPEQDSARSTRWARPPPSSATSTSTGTAWTSR